jgi:hypothetical protein
MKSVKNYFWKITIVLMGIIAGCTNVNEEQINLSANEQQKEEVFEQILNDRELTNEFMNEIMNDPSSMHWMMENGQFMNAMFSEDNLDYIMQHNEGMNQHMMQNMGNIINRDSSYRRQWDSMMQGSNHMH